MKRLKKISLDKENYEIQLSWDNGMKYAVKLNSLKEDDISATFMQISLFIRDQRKNL